MSSDPDLGATAPAAGPTNDASAATAPPVSSQAPPTPGLEAQAMVARWLQAQQPKNWWRVLAGGIVGLIILWNVIVPLKLGFLVPVYTLAFGLLLPTTVVLYWWERGTPALVPRDALSIALISGAVAGLLASIVLFGLLNLSGYGLLDSIVVAVIVEVLKVAAVAYLLLDARLRREIDGLILGFVAALGFSALQTASNGFITFLQTNTGGYTVPDSSAFSMFRPAISNMDVVLAGQMFLQLLGDWVWTAILCAAIWRERGAATVLLTRGVGIAFGIVVVLHALWSYSYAHDWIAIDIGSGLPLFSLLIAAAGIVVLSFFVWESLERASLGPDAPPPPPLEQALPAYLAGLGRRLSRQA